MVRCGAECLDVRRPEAGDAAGVNLRRLGVRMGEKPVIG